jgi:serine/threonine protein kinase
VWKRLEHRNIVPLLGITPNPLQLISEWMPGGDLTEYIKKHSGADRLGLASTPAAVFDRSLTPATSYLMSLKVFTFSTPATLFTVI